MPLRSILLALALTACTGSDEDTGLGGGDTADTGGDSGGVAQASDCTFQSVEPLTTSWNGGEEATLTLSCSAPSAVKSVVYVSEVSRIEVSMVSADDDTWTGSFITAAQPQTGLTSFELEVEDRIETSALAGDVLRYRLDPDELSRGVEANTAPPTMHFGLSSLAVSVRSSAKRTLVVGSNSDGAVVAGVYDELGEWDGDALDVQARHAGPISSFESGTTQAVMVPLVDTDAGELQMLLAVDNGLNRRTEFIVLDFDAVPNSSSVGGGSFQLDSEGELSSYDVVLLGTWTKDSGSTVTSMSYAVDKTGTGSWTTNWEGSFSSQVLHVGPTMELSDGSSGMLVLTEGSGDGPVATWLSAEGGKTLASQTLKDITGTPLAISSTAVTQEKGDTLAVSLLDDDGGLFLLQAGADTSQDIGVQALALGNIYISRAIKAEVRRLVDATESPSWRKGGGFRSLEPGSTLYFPPLQARGTEGGDLHIALSVPMDRGSGTGPEETLVVASWMAGEEAVDLGSVPDAVELVAAGGRSVLSGSTGEKLTGSPVIFNHSATGTSDLGTITGDGSAELVLAGDSGWTVLSRGGQVVVVDPEGKELTNLPIDPIAGIQAYRVPNFRKVGDICVLSGLVRSVDADGETTSLTPGLLTVGPEGVGSATLKGETLTGCSFSRDEGQDMTGLCATANSDGTFGLGLGLVTLDQLPDAGQELSIDPGYSAWPTSSTEDLAGLPAVWLHRGAEASWGVDDVSITVLGSLPSGPVGPDMVAVLPYDSDLACPVATYFVPGASTDVSKNLASAVMVSTSNEGDCSDLALPEAAIDLDGRGLGTVLMSQPSATEGGRDLFEMVWDGTSLLALPTITVPEWTSLEVGDFDGDGFEDLLVQLGAIPEEDGTSADPLSGLMFRSGGLKQLSPDIRAEVTMVKNGDALPPSDDDAVVAAVYELSDSNLDLLVVGGTYGRHVKKGNFTTVGVGQAPPPVLLHSWGAVLD